MEIAEEEIERTAQEAVKAALLEVGGELAFEKERADQMEAAKLNLELENQKLKKELSKKNNQSYKGLIRIDMTNASRKQIARFEHLYARYYLKERTALNIKSKFLTTIGVSYTLGIIGLTTALFVGMKQCVPEPEPGFPKIIKKAENKLSVPQKQMER